MYQLPVAISCQDPRLQSGRSATAASHEESWAFLVTLAYRSPCRIGNSNRLLWTVLLLVVVLVVLVVVLLLVGVVSGLGRSGVRPAAV
jgi:hypothetical protein